MTDERHAVLRLVLDETLRPYLVTTRFVSEATFEKMLDGVTARLAVHHNVAVIHPSDQPRRHDPSDHDCRGGVEGDRFPF